MTSAIANEKITITRYGKPVAAIVSIDDLEQLQRLRAAKLTGGLANLAEDWEDAAEFPQELDNVIRDR